MPEVAEQLQSIFRNVLDQPHLILSRDSNANTVEDWDSLAHINLISSIEQRFKIRFALGELQDMRNVGDLIDAIDAKLAER